MAESHDSLVSSAAAEWIPAKIDGISVKVLRRDKASG